MAYTNTWDETQPLGPAAANTIDDIIRSLKIDIRERMNTILSADGQWDDDPIVLDVSQTFKTGQQLLLSPHSAQTEDDDNTYLMFDRYIQASGVLRQTIPVQKGWKITKVELLLDKDAATSVALKFNKVSFGTSPTTTLIASATLSTTGVVNTEVYSGEETANGGSVYMIELEPNTVANFKYYGARITYDEVEV